MLNWLFRKKRVIESSPIPATPWPLDLRLLDWVRGEHFTLEDATKGVQVWGMTGSGKSSGSGKALARSYLHHGMGGLVLCAKPGEADTWREYCRITGRSSDLRVFSPSSEYRFNVLDHEAQRPGAGGGLTENILQLLMQLAETSQRNSGRSGQEGEAYWKNSLQQLVRNAIDLLSIAQGRVSVSDLYRLVISAPVSFEQMESAAWRGKSLCWQLLQKGDTVPKSGYREHDFSIVADYFLIEYPGLSEKTRSIIVSMFTSLTDVLNRGVLRELFGKTTNLTPEDCLDGRIIVVDLPVKEFAEIGLFAATIWKTQFQKALERRDIQHNARPCFLFVDESQLFTTQNDAMFQTTARSSRCCTVYLTQNINNYLTAYSGESGQAQAKSLLGNLGTHVVHALGDSETAEFIATLIGRSKQWFANGSTTHQPFSLADEWYGGRDSQSTGGYSETMEYEVQPAQLGRMATGGVSNGFQVEALIWRGGQTFRSTGRSYLWTSFNQRENA
ncbi:MAG: type IV secretory system conjugative DNA transfer family protein [Fimbriiglobus sp.]